MDYLLTVGTIICNVLVFGDQNAMFFLGLEIESVFGPGVPRKDKCDIFLPSVAREMGGGTQS